jgi:hypothetical protein
MLLFWAVVCVFFEHPCHGRCVGNFYLVVVAVQGAPAKPA